MPLGHWQKVPRYSAPKDFGQPAFEVIAAASTGSTQRNSMQAIAALDAARTVNLLITRVVFPAAQPHGFALARMARMARHGLLRATR